MYKLFIYGKKEREFFYSSNKKCFTYLTEIKLCSKVFTVVFRFFFAKSNLFFQVRSSKNKLFPRRVAYFSSLK